MRGPHISCVFLLASFQGCVGLRGEPFQMIAVVVGSCLGPSGASLFGSKIEGPRRFSVWDPVWGTALQGSLGFRV